MDWQEILKVRTKGPDGKWKTREREAELDRQTGFGGGGGKGPNRGGGPPSPHDKDEDEDEPYTKDGGMAEDEVSTRYPITMEEDAMVTENDERCCEMVKEILVDYVLESTPASKTHANIKKITNTIRNMKCASINNLFENENVERRSAKLFGVNLYEMEPTIDRPSMKEIIEAWQDCIANENNTKDDLTPQDVGLGELTEGEMKPSERFREQHRDWRDAVVSPKKKIGRRKPVERGRDI